MPECTSVQAHYGIYSDPKMCRSGRRSVLAAAHLDHDPVHCGRRHRNVRALCQRCHNVALRHGADPLYLGKLFAGIGISAMSGSAVVAVVLLILRFPVFLLTIRREAANVAGRFDGDYHRYQASVPRFWPKRTAVAAFFRDIAPRVIAQGNMARELRIRL